MYRFTPREQEPELQPFGRRTGGPPRKHTLAALLDDSQLPPIRPRCFGCSRPLAIAELSDHILGCDKVLVEHLMRFQSALADFKANPLRAFEVAEAWISRIRGTDQG